jgi:hypothetical protein
MCENIFLNRFNVYIFYTVIYHYYYNDFIHLLTHFFFNKYSYLIKLVIIT